MSKSNTLASVRTLGKQSAVKTILEINLVSQKHGLTLTAQDALDIVAARNAILKGRGRVEFGVEALGRLITEFATSGFIAQEDYATTIVDLLDVFYYLKNQSEDAVGDADLIMALRSLFEGPCAGSVDLLKDYELKEVLSAQTAPGRLSRGVDQYE